MTRTLYPFQREGVEFLRSRKSALLADDMGLGKTLQSLFAVMRFEGSPLLVNPILIVCPSSVKSVWARESVMLSNDLLASNTICRPSVDVLSGYGSFRWPRRGEIVVTSYEILDEPPLPEPRVELKKGELLRRVCWGGLPPSRGAASAPAPTASRSFPRTTVILDEVHRCKDRKSRAHRACDVLVEDVLRNEGRAYGLSATPILNRPQELRAILSLLRLEREVFRNSAEFMDGYGGSLETIYTRRGPVKTYSFPKEATAKPWVRERLAKVALRRTKAEVLPQLPRKSYSDVLVDVRRNVVLEKMERCLAMRGWDGTVTGLSSLDGVGAIATLRAEVARAKAAECLDDLLLDYEEANEPVVLFSAHLLGIESLARRKGWARIVGGTPAGKRAEVVADFQAGRLKGLAATIGAGGVGITLTRAAVVVFVDLAWTPALNNQAEDRVCRIGQERPVTVVRLVADHPLERRLHELLSSKQETIESTWKGASG